MFLLVDLAVSFVVGGVAALLPRADGDKIVTWGFTTGLCFVTGLFVRLTMI